MKPCEIAQRRSGRSRASAVLAAFLLFLLSTSGARPQEKAPEARQSPDIPLGPVERAEKEGTAYRVSLRDLTKLALQNNLDIAISDTNEELYQKRILQAYGPYDPALSVTLGAQSTIRPNTNLTNRSTQGRSNSMTLDTWNFTFSQNLPTGGGVQAILNSSRNDTNQQFALFSPQYNASTQIQFTQPLLRNRRIDQTRGTIRLANLDLKISDTQFKQTVVNTIGAMEGVYWDLVNALRDYEIKRQSVELARLAVENNRDKVRIGVLAPIEITVAQADMANRVVDLISSQQAINVAENNLRSMISNDRNAEIWKKFIIPTDTPEFAEYKVELDQAIDTAMRNRPELQQLSFQMQQNDINYSMSSNLKKWEINFIGSFGTAGVAGPQTVVDGVPIIDPALVGSIGTAYKSLFTEGFRSWYAGFNLQIPLRNRSLEGQLGQLQVQRRQLQMNTKSAEQKIVVQIRNAFDELQTNKQRVETAKVARELAQAQLDGETKRFQAGMSQNFLVLQRQRDLSAAQGTELLALIAYKKSVIALQQAMYTLIEEADFAIAGPPKVK